MCHTVIAAGYADRPLHLIGPRYYLTWWRLLKLLWAIVPVVAVVGAAFGQTLAEAPVGEIIRNSIVTGLLSFFLVAFWVTVVFAALERTSNAGALTEWSIDSLAEIGPKGAGKADMIAALIFLALGIGSLFWDRFRGFFIYEDDALPLLSVGLWPWWIIGLIVLMAGQAALVVSAYVTGRWNLTFAVINTLLALAFAIPATALLATGQLVNPEFTALVFADNGVTADTVHTLAIITGAGIVGFPVWSVIDGWLKMIRDNRR